MSDTAVKTNVRARIKMPSLWRVILINDDFTPMEFVTEILIQVFGKSKSEAIDLMLRVHNTGKAQVGVFTKEIANAKTDLVRATAAEYGHPLECVAEEM